MSRLASSMAVRALRRGVRQGSRPWLVVGVVAAGATLLRRLASPKPEVVFRQRLEPGEALEIRALGQGAGDR